MDPHERKQNDNINNNTRSIQSPPIKHHAIHNGHQSHHHINVKHANGHNGHNGHKTKNGHNGIVNNNVNNNKTQKKIRKFVRCSKKIHQSLRTTTALDKLEIKILRGGLQSDELLYIKQHSQYQVRYNDEKHQTLLATIPKHYQMSYNFKAVATFTQYIVNHKFIRFRNRGPTQTKNVSLWRIYKFDGEQTLFNVWIIKKASQNAINNLSKKNKNYHSNAWSSSVNNNKLNINGLGEDVMRHIFSYLDGSKFHCWIHIHEIIDRSHHRSNLLGLEFDSTTRNVHVMQRSPALLKKIRQIGDKYYTKKFGVSSILTDTFFKKSVEMFKAIY